MRRWALLGGALGCAQPATEVPASPVEGPPAASRPVPHGSGPSPFHVTPQFSFEDPPAGPKRSVVVISLDTVSAPILALYGGPAQTPNLADLANDGARFADAVTHFPETCLSHWTLMTGVLPEAHGNAPAHAGSEYPGPTLAELAQHAGYRTGAVIGGVTLQDTACGLSRGFDTYDDQFPLDPQDMRRPAAQVTAAALRWLQNGGDQPFFLFVHYFDAHFPYTPPAPWDRAYLPEGIAPADGSDAALRPARDGDRTPSPDEVTAVRALYAGEVSALDGALKPLLDAIPDDAVVVVTADHGESFGHDYWFNHRGVLWDDVVRVPLVIRGLSARAPGSVVEGPVGLVDVARTVASAAGFAADSHMAGRDLGRVDPQSPVVAQLSVTDPWVGSSLESVRDGAWKRLAEGASVHYFSLVDDPHEQHAQSSGPASLEAARDSWRSRVDAWRTRAVAAPVRSMSGPELEHLQALGYVDPTASPPPHGKAPGQRRGPPHGATPPTPKR